MNPHETMKVCPNGHYYQGDHCPYCPTVYNDETRLYPQTGSNNIPICPHCGKPIRNMVNILGYRSIVIGSVGNCYDQKVPWNYEWDGVCENCGYDYNITMMQNLRNEGLGNKHTYIKVTQKTYNYNMDQWLVLSGVEIQSFFDGDINGRQKIFLSTNELKQLLKVLKVSPILQQEDCDCEKGFMCT